VFACGSDTRDAIRLSSRSRAPLIGTLLVAGALSFGVACERLKQPPRPANVPEGAVRNRDINLWMYRAPDDSFRTYYSTGRLAQSGQMKAGTNQRTGTWQSYASDGERVTATGDYLNDWRDGLWRYFDGTEQLYLTVEYLPEPKRFFGFLAVTDYGNENGPFERYFPDGRLEERGVFWSGYYHGPIVRYHRNGNKAFEGQYETDHPVGRWRFYYPEGNLEREEYYRNGRLHGVLRNYYSDGGLYHETVFEDGQEVGPKRIFPRSIASVGPTGNSGGGSGAGIFRLI
jgi:antitoxin component YwqK of YwqJK toxin-antitoxin module